MSLPDPNFCLVPFTGFSISPRGIIRSCCVQYSRNMVNWKNVKDLTENIPWPTENIIDLQNRFKSEDIIKNTPDCWMCWHDEKVGLDSFRKKYNALWLDKVGNIQDIIDRPNLKTLDLQFGHLCNLSCVMCNTSLSSHHHATKTKLHNQSTDIEQKEFYKKDLNYLPKHLNADWTIDDFSYNKVKSLSENITEIKISGGEPLFNPRFLDFLTFLTSKEKPIKRIHLTTNGTIYNDNIVELLNKVETVVLKISLESVGIEDEFIRWPTNWEEKHSNIKKFVSNINSKNRNFSISTCLQSLNIFSLNKIQNYVNELNKELNKDIIFQIQNVGAGDIASLSHCDNDYLNYYINQFTNKTEPAVKRCREGLHQIFDGKLAKETKKQVKYFMDMSKLSGIPLEEVFPIYWQYHKKYLD